MNQDVYRESGLTVTLPRSQSFRFESTSAYKKLSGSRLREMDFCWLDDRNNDLRLLEILDLSKISLNPPYDKDMVTMIIEKTVDSLLMFLSLWCDTKYSSGFPPIVRPPFNTHDFHTSTIKIFFVLRVNYGNVSAIQPLKDHVWTLLQGRLSLLDIDIDNFKFIDQQTAIESSYLPISR